MGHKVKGAQGQVVEGYNSKVTPGQRGTGIPRAEGHKEKGHKSKHKDRW